MDRKMNIKQHVCVYMYENSIKKPTKTVFKKWGGVRRVKKE
jgi:hypothetical protein